MKDERPAAEFSVVIPTYNRAETMMLAIQSVLEQSFERFELIVVDDGSTDRGATRTAVEALDDDRVRYVRKNNGGQSSARNLGAGCGSGRWIVFLDSDDMSLPGWLEGLSARTGDDEVGVVCCGLTLSFDDGRVQSMVPRPLGPLFDNVTGLFQAGTFAIRRDLYEVTGGFDESLQCIPNTELALRLIEACATAGLKVASVPEELIRVNRDTGTTRVDRYSAARYDSTTYILRRYSDRFRRDPVEHANYLGVLGFCAAQMGRYGEARRAFAKGIRANPSNAKNYLRLLVALNPRLGRRAWSLAATRRNRTT